MSELLALAISEMEQVKSLFLRSLEKTPDDKLGWSPSETARTPLQLIAHSSYSLGFILTMLQGTPYSAPTMEQADREFMEMDSGVTTRDQAIELFTEKSDEVISYLKSLDGDDLAQMIDLPFGMGQAPLSYMVGIPAIHTRTHLAQLEYVQTIYGDRSW